MSQPLPGVNIRKAQNSFTCVQTRMISHHFQLPATCKVVTAPTELESSDVIFRKLGRRSSKSTVDSEFNSSGYSDFYVICIIY